MASDDSQLPRLMPRRPPRPFKKQSRYSLWILLVLLVGAYFLYSSWNPSLPDQQEQVKPEVQEKVVENDPLVKETKGWVKRITKQGDGKHFPRIGQMG